MERKEMVDILNGMCERCLIKGIITTLNESKTLCEVFDRFSNNLYTNDGQYSDDILYLYNLATKLHQSGNTSLEESYSIYNAILSADRVDFVEIKEPIENLLPNQFEKYPNLKVIHLDDYFYQKYISLTNVGEKE